MMVSGDQPVGNQYFLILSPSVLNNTLVPRCSRICLVVRLIIPWRFPDWAKSTFPEAVTLKRFFAPDFVFSLGIWLSFPTWTLTPSSLPGGRGRVELGPPVLLDEA